MSIKILRKFVIKLYLEARDQKAFIRIKPHLLFKELTHGFEGQDMSPSRFKEKKTYILTDQQINNQLINQLGPVYSNLNEFSDLEISNSVFYIYFECDSTALPLVKRIIECDGKFVPHMQFSNYLYRFIDKLTLKALKKTFSKKERISHSSHFYIPVHENICEALNITKKVEGDFVEVGVYKGATALTAINYIDELKKHEENFKRNVWLFDTYDGFNYDSANKGPDISLAGSHKLYGVKKTLEYLSETFKDTISSFNTLPLNIITDPLPLELKKIAVAHIDCDLYESSKQALLKISKLITPGGIIICKGAACTPGHYGFLFSMEEFLSSKDGQSYTKFYKGSQYFLLKRY